MEKNEQQIFLPEDVDEQIDDYLNLPEAQAQPEDVSAFTVQALQRYFSATDQDATLQRVWQRFAQQRATRPISSRERKHASVQGEKRYGKMPTVHSIRSTRHSLLTHHFSQIAALIIVTLLVGSMIVVFQRFSSNHSGSGIPITPTVAPATTQGSLMFAWNASTVYRLDKKTHQQLWQFHVSSTDVSGPGKQVIGSILSVKQVIGTTVYVEDTGQQQLFALDIATGKVRWQVQLSSSLGYPYPFWLVASGDTLYMPVSEKGSPGVEALSLSNGAKKWQHSLPGNASSSPGRSTVSLITASDQAVYGESGNDSTRFALSASDGHLLWQKDEEIAHGGGIDRGFVVDGVLDVVKNRRVTSGMGSETYDIGMVVGYDAASGKQLWSQTLDNPLSNYGLFDDATKLLNGVVYVSTNLKSSPKNSIYAFSTKDGTQLWHYQDTSSYLDSYQTVAGPVVYYYRYNDGHGGQTLVALNTSNGKVRWTYTFHDPLTVEYAPAADDSQVYLSLPNNTIQILRASDGKPVGSFKAPGAVDPNNRVHVLVPNNAT